MRLASLAVFTATALASMATPLPAQTFDVSVPPGNNFDTAEFRLWHPEGVDFLRGILVLVPGSNRDGREVGGGVQPPGVEPCATASLGDVRRRAIQLRVRALEARASGGVCREQRRNLLLRPGVRGSAAGAPRTSYPTSWLPNEALALAWQKLGGGTN